MVFHHRRSVSGTLLRSMRGECGKTYFVLSAIIGGSDVPVRVPERVPAVHIARARVRAVPEVRHQRRTQPYSVVRNCQNDLGEFPSLGRWPKFTPAKGNQSAEARYQFALPSEYQQNTRHAPELEPDLRDATIRYSHKPEVLVLPT